MPREEFHISKLFFKALTVKVTTLVRNDPSVLTQCREQYTGTGTTLRERVSVPAYTSQLSLQPAGGLRLTFPFL